MTMLRTTLPVARINSDLGGTLAQQRLCAQHWHKFSGQKFQHEIINGACNDLDTRFNADFLHQAFVYVATETVGNYPYPYFTEKTWKGLATGRPWLIIGAQNSIAQLRNWGFQSFNQWWDETYDQLPNILDRIQTVTKILCDLEHQDLQKIEQEMLPVLQHNQQHLVTFQKQNLNDLVKELDAK